MVHHFDSAPVRRIAVLVCLLAALPLIIFSMKPQATAVAEPNEGGTDELWRALEEASAGHYAAQEKLQTARQREIELTAELGSIETNLATLNVEVSRIASQAYENGPLATMSAITDSQSLSVFVEKMTFLDEFSYKNRKTVTELVSSQKTLSSQNEQIKKEITEQENQEKELAERKQQAEKALANSGGGAPTSGYTSGGKPAAAPYQGGTGEGCSEDDPTTGSCVTPRLLHAYNQARGVGFTNFTACNTGGTWGEHPVGRACDFSAAPNGFGAEARNGDRLYGNMLAGWFTENANAIGVLYVIWFREIWMPGTGWRSYSGGGGPSAEHTDHVHLSVR